MVYCSTKFAIKLINRLQNNYFIYSFAFGNNYYSNSICILEIELFNYLNIFSIQINLLIIILISFKYSPISFSFVGLLPHCYWLFKDTVIIGV